VHGDESKPQEFVLLQGKAIEHTMMPQDFEGSYVSAVAHTYIVARPDGSFFEYDMTNRSFQPPSKLVQQRVSMKNMIAKTFRDLGIGNFIETWPNILTNEAPTTQPGR
jgi:hypothetical protein